jgi:hypothetical protein
MYFYIFILCLNTITSMINTNTFFDFTDFQTHMYERRVRRTKVYEDATLHCVSLLVVLRLCVLPGGGSLHPKYCPRIANNDRPRSSGGGELGEECRPPPLNVLLHLQEHLRHDQNKHLSLRLSLEASADRCGFGA